MVPDRLVSVANSRLETKNNNNNGSETDTCTVVNPINNYEIIPQRKVCKL
jgi:hypothetical protein